MRNALSPCESPCVSMNTRSIRRYSGDFPDGSWIWLPRPTVDPGLPNPLDMPHSFTGHPTGLDYLNVRIRAISTAGSQQHSQPPPDNRLENGWLHESIRKDDFGSRITAYRHLVCTISFRTAVLRLAYPADHRRSVARGVVKIQSGKVNLFDHFYYL